MTATPRFRAPDYVVLVVTDLDRSLAFYCGVLGLPLGHRSGPCAQLATGRTRLAPYERTAMASTLGAACRTEEAVTRRR